MNKIYFFIVLLPTIALGNMNPKIGFKPYPNYYFVETGTFVGQGIRFALEAGYPQIYSVEIDKQYVENAKRRFRNNSNVEIILGDSGEILFDVIKNLDKPITFWLDGHCGEPRTDGAKNTPIIEELDQIKRHPIKNHTIIIDDMHCTGRILFDFLTKEDIIAKIKEINPDYEISYIAGGDQGEYPNNIMIAQIH